ncbi:MAG: SH3 domain-containing protein [Marinibacterium sp.]|nr:SH3 domain-containing protein [Marinibacterium sp.]
MNKFVFVSFAFMAWAFYELSGGADFEPRPRPTETARAPAPAPAARVAALPAVAPAPAAVPAVAVDNVAPAINAALQTEDDAPQLPQLLGTAEDDGTSLPALFEASRLAASPLDTFAPTALDTPAPVIEPSAPERDIREITGSRVNMRAGPGTNYNVLARLTLGDKVEVLSVSDNGWVRLRPLDGGETGWMADFLVSAD